MKSKTSKVSQPDLRHEARNSTFVLSLVDAMCTTLAGKVAGAGRPSSCAPRTQFNWVPRTTFRREIVRDVAQAMGAEGLPKFSRSGGRECVGFTFAQPVSVVVRVAYFTRAILEVLHDNLGVERLQELSYLTLCSQFKRCLSWPEAEFDKNAKYFCTRPMAAYLGQDLPLAPPASYGSIAGKDWLLFSGALRRILSNRVNSFCPRNTHLMNGLLQGVKRACFQVSASLVESTLRNHRATLSVHIPIPKVQWGEEGTKGTMTWYIRRVCHKLYKEKLGEPRLYEPSSSAHYGYSRKEGGGVAAIDDLLHEMEAVSESELYEMVETRPGKVEEYRARPTPSFQTVLDYLKGQYSLQPLRNLVNFDESLNTFTPEHHPTFAPDLLDQGLDALLKGVKGTNGWSGKLVMENSVEVSPVLEPLKVRLVSKGEPIKYWLSMAMQKYMWNGLQRSEVFRLTGRPLMQADLVDLFDADDAGMWVSGDYSSATDTIKMGWTIRCFEEILGLSGVDVAYAALLRRVIYGQLLTYGSSLPEWAPVAQLSGQLMGSTLSFPILCILNLAAYWKAVEETSGTLVSLDKLKVMVNGDDILFRCGDPKGPLYQNWLKAISLIGFKLSPGKNYVHKRYLTVNSQAYDFNPVTKNLKPIGFLNVGLLINQAKVSRRERVNLTPLQGKYDEVIAGACSKLRAHRRYIHYNAGQVKQLTYGGRFSLFVDPLLGGLGFHLVPEVAREINFTRFQKGFAKFCLRQVRKGFTGRISDFPKTYLGVVMPRSSTQLARPDTSWGSFKLVPKIGPLVEGSVVKEPLNVGAPILQGGLIEAEGSPTLRFPRVATMRAFRKERNDGRLCGHIKRDVLLSLSGDHLWVSSPHTF